MHDPPLSNAPAVLFRVCWGVRCSGGAWAGAKWVCAAESSPTAPAQRARAKQWPSDIPATYFFSMAHGAGGAVKSGKFCGSDVW